MRALRAWSENMMWVLNVITTETAPWLGFQWVSLERRRQRESEVSSGYES